MRFWIGSSTKPNLTIFQVLFYQPPVDNTFLSKQTSHRNKSASVTILFSRNKPATGTNQHQPPYFSLETNQPPEQISISHQAPVKQIQ
jgi:hypothetical protein